MLQGLSQHFIALFPLVVFLQTNLAIPLPALGANQDLFFFFQDLPTVRPGTKLILWVQFLLIFVVKVLESIVLSWFEQLPDCFLRKDTRASVFWAIDGVVPLPHRLLYIVSHATVAKGMAAQLTS